MGQIISEGLENLGRIDDDGYMYNSSGDRIGHICEDGYIIREDGSRYGQITEDGTIIDSSLNGIGRIQADGYVYLHSKRFCHVDSELINKIAPKAWNAGHPVNRDSNNSSTNSDDNDSGILDSLGLRNIIKIIAGIILGIMMFADGACSFFELFLVIPIMIGAVYVICLVLKIVWESIV